MNFQTFGNDKAPTLLLIPGLGVSYEIFLPLIRLTEDKFRIIAVEVDGFTLGKYTSFTSVDDQASQVIDYIKTNHTGHLDCAYGLSLGGKILSRILERNELTIDHAILDAAPLLPLPNWLINPLRYYQAANVWTCYHWTGFWKFVFHSHYFDVLLDECRKTWPWGGKQAVLDGYKIRLYKQTGKHFRRRHSFLVRYERSLCCETASKASIDHLPERTCASI